jgi:DNA (cytosine-5)-methyltransferase 1
MKTTIKVGSDFSGVGAFNQALMRLGIDYQEVFACDMDKFARQTFIHNYGEPEYYPMNVYDREIPKESLDIYMTSPPCQAFSMAGKRLGKEDARGILFFNSLEFIQVNNPRFFIFENVRGLLSHDKDNKKDKIGRTFKEWIDYLGGKSVNGITTMMPIDGAVPYHLHYKVLNAKKHGVPQNRERVFLIGIRDDQDNTFTWPAEDELTKRLKNVLEDSVDDKYFLSEKMINSIMTSKFLGSKPMDFSRKDYIEENISKCIKVGGDVPCFMVKSATSNGYQEATERVIQINPSKESGGVQPYQQNRVYDKNGICPALCANLGGDRNHNILKDYKIRRLTPRECFRLMDFPDTFSWPVSDSQAYKQAGNSIVVRVLEKIINNLPL